MEPVSATAATVLVSSHDERYYKEWPRAAAFVFYIPPLDEQELRAVRAPSVPWDTFARTSSCYLSMNDDEFRARFFEFGGFPRYLSRR
jgi:hypothetical protein